MTEEQANVYLLGQIAIFNAKIAGMQAENAHSIAVNGTPKYREEVFESEANESGIHHNAIIGTFQENAKRE